MSSTKEKFNLRSAVMADAKSVASCASNAYRKYVDRIGIPPQPMLEDYSQVINTEQVWIAEILGKVVGFMVLIETNEGFLLDNVAVDPNHSGLGIGKALLQLGEAEAKRQGYSSIYLYTHEKMYENQALYCRYGYSEYDRRVEGGYDRIFMRKML